MDSVLEKIQEDKEMNEDSILLTIKKLVGLDAAYDAFDEDIIIHINYVMLILNQLGVGPDEVYSISGYDDTWDDFLGDDPDLESVKSYIANKVKLVFDPPTSGGAMDALKNVIDESEWRLNVQVDPGKEDDEDEYIL